MKSILALIVLVAVANAGVIKEGGLKGSWADEIEVISAAADLVAPTVGYSGTVQAIDEWYSEFPNFDTEYFANTTMYLEGDYSQFDFTFEIMGELDYDDSWYFNQDDQGGVEVVFWTGVAPNTHTLPIDCETDLYNRVDCEIYIHDHIYAGVYKPMITVWDMNGNWATYTEASFTVATDKAEFEIACNDPDVRAPILSGAALSSAAIVLGMEDDMQDSTAGGQTIISVQVNDGADDYETIGTDATANMDPNGSGIYGVWATISTGTGDAMMSEDIMLYAEEFTATTGNRRYAAALAFANFAEPAVWTVTCWATDYAGNVGTATALTLTVTYSETLLDTNGGVFSCQTLDLYVDDFFDYDNVVTVTADEYDTVTFLGTCTEKSTTIEGNYIAVAYTSDVYMTTGSTEAMTQTIWNNAAGGSYGRSNFGEWVSWTSGWEDVSLTWVLPGATVSLDSWGDTLYVQPAAPQVSYWLTEVFTITSTGGVQRYNLADGAASSVAPSVFAVAIAAAVALFRL